MTRGQPQHRRQMPSHATPALTDQLASMGIMAHCAKQTLNAYRHQRGSTASLGSRQRQGTAVKAKLALPM